MNTEKTVSSDTSTEIINTTLHTNKKAFIGSLLTFGGVIFLLAGIMFFITLMSAIYFKLDILIAFVIGSLVVGIAAFSVGTTLSSK